MSYIQNLPYEEIAQATFLQNNVFLFGKKYVLLQTRRGECLYLNAESLPEKIASTIVAMDRIRQQLQSQDFSKIDFSKIDLKYFRLLDIQDTPTLITVVKKILKSKENSSENVINDFNIDPSTEGGQEALIEIAKLTARQSGFRISRSIRYYRIDASTKKGQEALIEIAKLSAQRSGMWTSRFIQNYGIQDQAALIEIAKLAVQNEEGVSEFIQNYKIDHTTQQGQEALIEIAKLATTQDGKGTSRFIRNYQINHTTQQGQQALVEIAKLAARQDGKGTSEFIQSYQIDATTEENQKSLSEILLECLFSNLEINFLNFRMIKASFDNFVYVEAPQTSLERVTDVLTKFKAENFFPFEKAFNVLKELEEKTKEKDTFLIALVHSTKWLLTAAALRSQIFFADFPDIEKLLETILKYPDPKMRYKLLQAAFHLETSHQLPAKKDLYLVDLLLKNYGISEPIFLKHSRLLHDGACLKMVLDTLVLLKQYKKSPEIIKSLIEEAIVDDKVKMKEVLLLLQGLLQAGYADRVISGELDELKKLFKNVFTEVVPLRSEDSVSKFFAVFGTQREAASLLTYAAKHKGSQEMIECLGRFVDSVLDSQFPQIRYQTPHLDKIEDKLKEKWMKNHSFNLEELISDEETGQRQTNYFEFFYQKVAHDKHLNPNQYPLLFAFLNNPKNFSSFEPKDENELLQNKIIRFIQESPLPTGEQLRQLRDIKSLLSSISPQPELVNDIQGAIDNLFTSKKDIKNFQMYFTDHFWDLFRCGSEVSGSCQRINGSPELNKGLLAYVLDGKNKLLEIKDKNGNIAVRAILRLLIDNNQKPVLFLERVYSQAGIEDKLINAIEKGAIKLAKEFNIPLFTAGHESVSLQSFGSNAPWEYVDAEDGLHADGIFLITQAKRIFN